jgi:hypothetical protein
MGTLLTPPGQPAPLAAGEFVQSGPPTLVTFRFTDVPPPSPLYVQRDDQLVVAGQTLASGEALNIVARLLPAVGWPPGQPTPSGASAAPAPMPGGPVPIIPITQTLTVAAGASSTQVAIALQEGYLLSLAITGTQATARGQTFCRAYIGRGSQTAYLSGVTALLISDYVSRGHAAGWPYGVTKHPLEGPGYVSSINLSNPAAGADWSYYFPNYTQQRLQLASAQLTTSATAGSRNVRVRLKDGVGNVIWLSQAQQSLPASTTNRLAIGSASSSSIIDTTTILCPIPAGLILPPGATVETSTLNIQSGDQWAAIYILAEQWVPCGG